MVHETQDVVKWWSMPVMQKRAEDNGAHHFPVRIAVAHLGGDQGMDGAHTCQHRCMEQLQLRQGLVASHGECRRQN